MSINPKIKELRKNLAISKLKQDGNTVVDQNKRIVCDKFSVSLYWLKTGEGDMYVGTESTVVEALKDQFHMNQEQKNSWTYFCP